VDVEAFSERGLIWRLVIQMRIPQIDSTEEATQQAQIVEKTVELALRENLTFQEAITILREYNDKAPHTFTSGPAIFSTLKAQNNVAVAAISGVILQGMACRIYLALAENNPALLESPLGFNLLNLRFIQDSSLAPRLIEGTDLLQIGADGAVKILSPQLEAKSEDPSAGINKGTRLSQLQSSLHAHFATVFATHAGQKSPPPVASPQTQEANRQSLFN
jgi:hypothetical protein